MRDLPAQFARQVTIRSLRSVSINHIHDPGVTLFRNSLRCDSAVVCLINARLRAARQGSEVGISGSYPGKYGRLYLPASR